MRELLEFLGVFAGIYLFDCVHWARREAFAFRAWWGRRTRLVAGEGLLGNERYGLVLAEPLLPFGRLFLTQPLPLSLTQDSAVSYVSTATNPGPRPPQVEAIVSFDAQPKVTREARRVQVDGRPFVEAGSARDARRIAELLVELSRSSPRARERRIERLVASSFDAPAVAARLAAFERASVWLRRACTTELVHVFVATPALAYAFGLVRVWLPLLVVLVVLQVVVTWSFVRAHRTLFPDERRARRGEAFLLACSPPSAMRAVDALSRDLLCEFHPLAVAAVLLPRAEFETVLETALRDALHPLPAVREAQDPAVRAAADSWRERLLRALEGFARAQGLATTPWREPPPRLDPDCRAYCPRCTRQFTVPGGVCERCQGHPCLDFRPSP